MGEGGGLENVVGIRVKFSPPFAEKQRPLLKSQLDVDENVAMTKHTSMITTMQTCRRNPFFS